MPFVVKDSRDLEPEFVSGWCGHGFESYSQSILQPYPWLIKAYDVQFSIHLVVYIKLITLNQKKITEEFKHFL